VGVRGKTAGPDPGVAGGRRQATQDDQGRYQRAGTPGSLPLRQEKGGSLRNRPCGATVHFRSVSSYSMACITILHPGVVLERVVRIVHAAVGVPPADDLVFVLISDRLLRRIDRLVPV
jgi:hypothetical protein